MRVARVLLSMASGLALGCQAGAIEDRSSRECKEPIERPALAACVVSDAIHDLTAVGSGLPQLRLELEGSVEAMGDGPPTEGCFILHDSWIGQAYSSDSPELAQARWIRVVDGAGVEAAIGVIAPDFAFDASVSDRVSVSLSHDLGGHAPAHSSLELRHADTGELLLWLGFAGAVDQLDTPPEVSFGEDELVCVVGDECVDKWHQYALEVLTDATVETLDYGEQRRIGGLVVTHGGLDVQAGPGRCSDAFVAWAAAAAWK